MGSKRTIFIRLSVGRYKWYQSRSPTPMWGFVWPRNLMGHNENVVSVWGGVCDVPHQIGENVSDAIYVETPLNQVDAF